MFTGSTVENAPEAMEIIGKPSNKSCDRTQCASVANIQFHT